MRLFYPILLLFLITSCSEENPLQIQKEENTLPYIGHVDVVESKENGQKITDTIFETIPYFSFLNQDSIEVNKSTYKPRLESRSHSAKTTPHIAE